MDDEVCEICGKPATFGLQDIEEIPSDGGYRHYQCHGKPYFRCADHVCAPKRWLLDEGGEYVLAPPDEDDVEFMKLAGRQGEPVPAGDLCRPA